MGSFNKSVDITGGPRYEIVVIGLTIQRGVVDDLRKCSQWAPS